MRKLLWICLLARHQLLQSQEQSEFTVLQMEHLAGRHQQRRYDAIVDEIIRLKPDFVTFSEVRNYNNTRFCDRIVQSLKAKRRNLLLFSAFQVIPTIKPPSDNRLTYHFS